MPLADDPLFLVAMGGFEGAAWTRLARQGAISATPQLPTVSQGNAFGIAGIRTLECIGSVINNAPRLLGAETARRFAGGVFTNLLKLSRRRLCLVKHRESTVCDTDRE